MTVLTLRSENSLVWFSRMIFPQDILELEDETALNEAKPQER